MPHIFTACHKSDGQWEFTLITKPAAYQGCPTTTKQSRSATESLLEASKRKNLQSRICMTSGYTCMCKEENLLELETLQLTAIRNSRNYTCNFTAGGQFL